MREFHGNGIRCAIPEDDKMWVMLENGYSSVEFDYMTSPEQVGRRSLRLMHVRNRAAGRGEGGGGESTKIQRSHPHTNPVR